MRTVVLIILFITIILLGLSFVPNEIISDNTNFPNNKELIPIKGKEEFYNKLGVNTTENQKEIEKEIQEKKENKEELIVTKEEPTIEEKKENIITPVLDIIKENDIEKNKLSINISSWRLAGQQKNILVTNIILKNGFDNAIKNKEKEISCVLLNKDNINLGEAKAILNINIKENSILELIDVNFDFVDIDTTNIKCDIKDFIKKELNITEIKPLKELKESKKNEIQFSADKKSGGFMLNDNTILKEKKREDIPLPSLD